MISFIYQQIAYQRREAIRTMVSYCNEQDTSPYRLRTRIRNYFDGSEKFSGGLTRMVDSKPDFAAVKTLLDRVDGFDDAEQLYYQTRRLLDERFRPDWAAANLYAIAYRDRGRTYETFVRLFDDMVAGLSEESRVQEDVSRFLAGFLTALNHLDRIFAAPIIGPLVVFCVERLYDKYGLTYVGMIDEMQVPDDVRQLTHLNLVNRQLKRMTNARYSRVIG